MTPLRTEQVDRYLGEIKARLHNALQEPTFVGHQTFEVNIKLGTICNMNVDTRESLKL